MYEGEARAVMMSCELCWAAAEGDVPRVRHVAGWWMQPAAALRLRAELVRCGVANDWVVIMTL